MLVVKTLAKGQVVIPAELRKRLGIRPGSALEVREAEGHLELHPLPQDAVAAFRGSLCRRPSLARELEREHRRELKRDAKR
jgi:AbrB family looped-hinge helix DNA binding protein